VFKQKLLEVRVVSKKVLGIVLCSALAASCSQLSDSNQRDLNQSDAGEPVLQSVFNGNNLDGWVAPANNTWWRANDGVLSVKSGPKRKGSDLLTEKQYKNFVAEFDFKMGEGTIDSGFYIRSLKQQIQIGISGSLKRDMTASLFVPKQGYPGRASYADELLSRYGWNSLKVKAVGKQYTVWLNGQQVMDYLSDSAVEQGPVGFQLHGKRDMAVDFRNIKIAPISE
jgi:3-keto-disaccharide hydrolase